MVGNKVIGVWERVAVGVGMLCIGMCFVMLLLGVMFLMTTYPQRKLFMLYVPVAGVICLAMLDVSKLWGMEPVAARVAVSSIVCFVMLMMLNVILERLLNYKREVIPSMHQVMTAALCSPVVAVLYLFLYISVLIGTGELS